MQLVKLTQQTKYLPSNRRNVVCNAQQSPLKLGDFVEKRKEIDKMRWEKVKEIGTTLDHIAKSEAKQTYEILNEILPIEKVVKECKDKMKKLSS